MAKTKKATPRLNIIFWVMSYIKVRNLLCSARNHKLSTFHSCHLTNTFYDFRLSSTKVDINTFNDECILKVTGKSKQFIIKVLRAEGGGRQQSKSRGRGL